MCTINYSKDEFRVISNLVTMVRVLACMVLVALDLGNGLLRSG